MKAQRAGGLWLVLMVACSMVIGSAQLAHAAAPVETKPPAEWATLKGKEIAKIGSIPRTARIGMT